MCQKSIIQPQHPPRCGMVLLCDPDCHAAAQDLICNTGTFFCQWPDHIQPFLLCFRFRAIRFSRYSNPLPPFSARQEHRCAGRFIWDQPAALFLFDQQPIDTSVDLQIHCYSASPVRTSRQSSTPLAFQYRRESSSFSISACFPSRSAVTISRTASSPS